MSEKTVKAKSAGEGRGWASIAQAAVFKTKTVNPVRPLSQAKEERSNGVKRPSRKNPSRQRRLNQKRHKPVKAVSRLKKAGAVRKPRLKKEPISTVPQVKPVLKEERPAGQRAVVGLPIAQATRPG